MSVRGVSRRGRHPWPARSRQAPRPQRAAGAGRDAGRTVRAPGRIRKRACDRSLHVRPAPGPLRLRRVPGTEGGQVVDAPCPEAEVRCRFAASAAGAKETEHVRERIVRCVTERAQESTPASALLSGSPRNRKIPWGESAPGRLGREDARTFGFPDTYPSWHNPGAPVVLPYVNARKRALVSRGLRPKAQPEPAPDRNPRLGRARRAGRDRK